MDDYIENSRSVSIEDRNDGYFTVVVYRGRSRKADVIRRVTKIEVACLDEDYYHIRTRDSGYNTASLFTCDIEFCDGMRFTLPDKNMCKTYGVRGF